MFFVCLLLFALTLSSVQESAPRIEVPPRSQTVVVGGSSFFVCTAIGNPSPRIEWKKNSRRVFSVRFIKHDIPNGSVLRIEPVKENRDNGKFECIAENGIGQPGIASAVLTVVSSDSLPSGFPQLAGQVGVKVVEFDRTVLLPCKVVHANPRPRITWLKNQLPLNMAVPRYTIINESLRIMHVNVDDQGTYECVAENSVGTAMSDPIRLYVKEKFLAPRFTIPPALSYKVIPGSSLNITCAAVGDPMPTVEWYIGGVDITPGDNKPIGENILMLENIMLPANYTCVAKSDLGTIETSTSLLVPDAKENMTSRGFPKTVIFSECTCENNPPEQPRDKICTPVYQAGCACPDRFACSDVNSAVEDEPVTPVHDCVDNGKTYRLGEEIKTPDYCVNCFCRKGAEVSCKEMQCPKFQLPPDKECYKVYTDGECCAVNVICAPSAPELTVHLIQEYPELIAEVSWSESPLQYEHVENYKLRYGRTNMSQMEEIIVDSRILNHTISGLDRDANYSFYLSAWNRLRWGPEAVADLSTTHDNGSLETEYGVPTIEPPSPDCPICHLRYLKHYEVKKCFPVFSEKCLCPSRFDCPVVETSPGNVCVYRNQTYKLGEAIPTENPCKRCSCRRSPLGGAGMSCLPVECPSHFVPPPEGCYEVYENDKCCPVDVKCGDGRSRNPSTEKALELFAVAGGKAYLPCDISPTAKNDSVEMIFWHRDDGGKTMSVLSFYTIDSRNSSLESAKHFFHTDLGARSFFNVTPNSGALLIDPVKVSDDGYYMCRTDFSKSATKMVSIILRVEPTCEYEGKTYRLGQIIYPKTDPCLVCLCNRNWTKGGCFDDCQSRDCLLETKMRYITKGCVPIYHEKKCCPTDFYCGTGDDVVPNNNNSLPLLPGTCVFDGKSYSIGEELDVKLPTNCVTCTCEIPPDFTCMQKACPGPPRDDYDNCRAIYYDGRCCPEYHCLQPQACEPVKCLNGCLEVTGRDGCAACLCDKLLCTTPKCPDGCEVEYDVPVGSCPRCRCSSIIVQLAPIRCSPIQCDPHCFETFGSDGCLTCICGPLCSTSKCDARCSLQRIVPEGQCPGCICPINSNLNLVDGIVYDQEIQCAPVLCGPTCHETVGEFGCPTCICNHCPPLNCTSGCEIHSAPLSGRCPKCRCTIK